MGTRWKQNLQAVLDQVVGKRLNGKVASHKTIKHTTEVLFNFFHTLHHLGNKVQDPKNVGSRHIEAAVRYWWHEKKLKPKTIEDYTSRLRFIFEHCLGKSGMVKPFPQYLPEVPRELLVVRTVANTSKSWTEVGVDVLGKLTEADKLNERLGLILRMQLSFGLRRKEALLSRPWKADHDIFLYVYPGEGKGNRPRAIPIETEVQRAVLNAVKSKIGKYEALGWPTMVNGKAASLEKNEARYAGYMRRLGLTKIDAGATGHGLRGQYAENKALLEGFVPATLEGPPGQMDKGDLTVMKQQVSEALGHSRETITGAYYGTLSRFNADQNQHFFQESMALGVEAMARRGPLPLPPSELLVDCTKILAVASKNGVEILISQAYELWLVHSTRHGTRWMPGDTATPAALAVAARTVHKLVKKQSEP